MRFPWFTALVNGPSMVPTLRPGDAVLVTDDSRTYGVADVIGRVVLRWWPSIGRVRRSP
jgi:signal peptidase I